MVKFTRIIQLVLSIGMVSSCSLITEEKAREQEAESRQIENEEGAKSIWRPITPEEAKLVEPVLIPDSKEVPPGEKFSAHFILQNLPDSVEVNYSATGAIVADDDGKGATIALTASGALGLGDEGKMQKYRVKASLPCSDGTVREFELEDEFLVKKPAVDLSPSPETAFYQQCANKLAISIPTISEETKITIQAVNADVITSQRSENEWFIVPRGNTVDVTVSTLAHGLMSKAGTFKYKAESPPSPKLQVFVDGRIKEAEGYVSKKSTIKFSLVPDPTFQSEMPKDARYSIASVEVLAFQQGSWKRISQVDGSGRDALKGVDIELHRHTEALQNATKIKLIANGVKRHNFQGKQIGIADKYEMEFKLK